jgi:hypothetical protein
MTTSGIKMSLNEMYLSLQSRWRGVCVGGGRKGGEEGSLAYRAGGSD